MLVIINMNIIGAAKTFHFDEYPNFPSSRKMGLRHPVRAGMRIVEKKKKLKFCGL
jgi:hypothetical protein